MLGINHSTSAAAAKSYFAEGLSRQDYYTKDAVTGVWHGEAAKRLGLAGDVRAEAFHALCDNLHPQTGKQLTPRMKENRRVGYDFTFSAPKGVSLLYGLTGDARIKAAMEQAAAETMREVEAEIGTRVRKGGASEDRTTGNMVWASFTHEVGRPVGGVPDPQLHIHAYAFNCTHDPVEQQWKAAQFGEIKRHAGYYEAAFHARLASSMRKMGFETRAHKGKWWDVAELSPATVELFSQRTAQVEQEAAKRGITSAAAKAELGKKTRAGKDGDLATDALRTAWWKRLTPEARKEVEAALAILDGGEDATATPRGRDQVIEQRVADVEESLAYAVAHSFERKSTVPERDVLAEALRHGQGRVLPEQLRRGVRRGNGGLLAAQMNGETMLTTREVLTEEQRMMAWARNSQGAVTPLAAGKARFSSAKLNTGQQDAVRHVLEAPNRLIMIQGKAGTGKTTLMQEAALAITQQSGKQVMTVAPTTRARDVLCRDGFNAQTVAWLLKNETAKRELKDNVLWVDEAGQMSTRDMNQVFALADQAGCRVILSGDTGQHGAVARGDAMRLLADKAGVKAAELSEILRQKGAYKDAVASIEQGRIAEGVQKLDQLGWVIEAPDEVRHTLVAQDYAWYTRAGENVLIVSPTHAEGRKVAMAVREELRKEGRLERKEHNVDALRNLQWTEAQRGQAGNYQPGLVVQFMQHAPGIKSGGRFEVVQADDQRVMLQGEDNQGTPSLLPLPLDKAGRFQVYEREELAIATGEKIRITQPGKSEEGRKLTGGSFYGVAGFRHDLRGNLTGIKLDNGATIAPDFGHVAYGYCSTSHGVQGETADRVLVVEGWESLPAASKEQLYVSLSRGRKGAKLYVLDKDELIRICEQRSSHRLSALELMDMVRLQERYAEVERWVENGILHYGKPGSALTEVASWSKDERQDTGKALAELPTNEVDIVSPGRETHTTAREGAHGNDLGL